MKQQTTFGIALALAIPATAFANTVELDANHEILPVPLIEKIVALPLTSPNARRVQTFTVEQAGLLSQADLAIYRGAGSVTDPLVVEIIQANADGTLPAFQDANFLGSVSVPSSLFTLTNPLSGVFTLEALGEIPYTAVDLSGLGINVEVDDKLAISISSNHFPDAPNASDGYVWLGVDVTTGDGTTDRYDGGRPYLSYDASFDGSPSSQGTDLGGDFGFRTYVQVPEPSGLSVLALAGLAMLGRRRR